MVAPDGGPTREEVAEALFGLADLAVLPDGSKLFQWKSRRVVLWDAAPVKPAVCQASFSETTINKPGGPAQRVWNYEWWIYHDAGVDPAAVPSTTTNAILDAVEAALGPKPWDAGFDRANLGGLVHSVAINGETMKVDGDIEGQALVIIPIQVIVP